MKASLTALMLTLFAVSYGQDYLLSSCDSFFYSIGVDTISAEWRQPEYDHSNWEYGRKSIGYGDGDDTTLIDPCTSVFIRIPFYLERIDNLYAGILDVDWDDGFVAYLNGHEILRKFLGPEGSPVAYNQLADRSREAYSSCWRRNTYPYFIDSSVMAENIRVGNNILSFQVHNDSINGSDLSFSCRFLNRNSSAFNPYATEWRALNKIQLDSSELPIVIIDIHTEEGMLGKRVMADTKIICNEGKWNKPSDVANVYNEWSKIEIRGQSSADWAKKSFNFELKDLLGATQDKALLGMDKDNDWALVANYTDRSLVRNKLIYSLAQQTNTLAPDSRFVELILDGDYLGVYQLLEKPKRGKGRIDIDKQEAFADESDNISGGYIFKMDKHDRADHEMYIMKYGSSYLYSAYPDVKEMSESQKDYIFEFWDSVIASQADSVLLDEQKGYRNFIDPQSYIDFSILNEVCKNSDGFRYSTFMYKPKDEPMHFGPLWDFDLSFGNSSAQAGDNPEGWQFAKPSNNVLMHTYFFKDTVLVHQFQQRYETLRQTILKEENINHLIDSFSTSLGSSVERNFMAWPYTGYPMDAWVGTPAESIDPKSDIRIMKNWVQERLAWMDENIGNIYYELELPDTTNNQQVGINAVLSDAYMLPGNGSDTIDAVRILSMTGSVLLSRQCNSVNQFEAVMADFPSGIYLVQLKSGGTWYTYRVVID